MTASRSYLALVVSLVAECAAVAPISAGGCMGDTCRSLDDSDPANDHPTMLQVSVPEAGMRQRKYKNADGEKGFSISEYVDALRRIVAHRDDPITPIRDAWVRYYSNVSSSIMKTVVKDGAVVDCIPFLKQPALLHASAALQQEAHAMHMSHSRQSTLPGHDDWCPDEHVPLTRVRLDHFRRHKLHAFGKMTGPPSQTSGGNTSRQASSQDYAEYFSGPPGYTYSISWSHNTNPSNYVAITLGVGGKIAPLPTTQPGDGHTLNQMWWLGNSKASKMISLEAGWCHSDYWTHDTALTLFIFSTPDNYQRQCKLYNGFNADSYNLHGGFVQYPNTPGWGIPLNEVRYTFAFKGVANGYEMVLTPFQEKSDGSLTFGESIAAGYYPLEHYCDGVQSFHEFSSGLELYVGHDVGFKASGKIFGWGYNENPFKPLPVKDEYSSAPEKEGWKVSYASYQKAYSAEFSGTYNPLKCINDLSAPC